MPELPTGTVTFLFTDVEGSTHLWERYPNGMRQALVRHDTLIETEVDRHGGVIVRPRGEGDSRFAVFARATEAVAAAVGIQQALHTEPGPLSAPLRVRMAIHTGEADLREGDYYGPAVNRCARLRAIAHGGQTLLSDIATRLVRDRLPERTSLRDLGDQQLSDLTYPERVYQLLMPDVPAEFPQLRSLSAYPNNLPLQVTSFIGRERELGELGRALAGTRLVTLTGSGGCGKTRLALQVAADLAERFPDGAWVVELASLTDPALVPATVAVAAAVREQPNQGIQSTLVQALRSRRLLLVLDNCEHLLDACARLADALLRGCPDIRILATSREALSIAGEVSWPVPSLALPGPAHLLPLDRLTQFEAVRLFIDRAVAVLPSFAATNENAPALAQVCHRLDGIPLAIELAAARVRVLTIEQIAQRLDQRFRLLTGGSRTALPRQQTLRAALDWSYDLLSGQERLLFHRLSIFAGGFTLEAAETVCSGGDLAPEDVLDLLARLVDKSLVVAEEQSDGAERYRLPETLSHYAQERLQASGMTETLCKRHATYYRGLADALEQYPAGPGRQSRLARLDQEQDNLRAALAWAVAPGGDRVLAARIGGALGWFWSARGHLSEGRRWLEALLERADPAWPLLVRAKLLGGAGELARAQGDYGTARTRLEEAVRLARASGEPRWVAVGLTLLGLTLAGGGAPAAAVPLYREGLELARRAGDLYWQALTLHSLGTASASLGDREAAVICCEQSLALFRELGDRWGQGLVMNSLGDIAAAHGEVERADTLYTEAAAIMQAVGDRWILAAVRCSSAGLALRRGDAPAARMLYVECLTLWHDLGYLPGVITGLIGCARAAAAQGEYRRAGRLLGAADAHFVTSGIHAGVLEGVDREALAQTVATIKAAADSTAFTAGWTDGQAMSLDQAAISERAESSDDVRQPPKPN